MTSTTLAFPTPASLGSLDHYIQAVNRFPLLTQSRKLRWAGALQQHDDIDAARSAGAVAPAARGRRIAQLPWATDCRRPT